jgi:cell fate (sporulation/competence/biofilm development) regulator YlbF (YheA/YmcA/DUF963 family)
MIDAALNDLELAPPSVVEQAARDFATALAETPQFRAYEETAERLRNDEAAQRAIGAYQARQQALQTLLMLNAVSAEEGAELERLRLAFLSEPAVAAYLQSQAELAALCQATADLLSQHVGLSFASACRPGCCG